MNRRLSLLFEEDIDSLIEAPKGFCAMGPWTYDRPEEISRYWQKLSPYDGFLHVIDYTTLIMIWSEGDLIRPISILSVT